MSLLTEQELLDAFDSIPEEEYDGYISYGRAIEAKVIEKIKAQGEVAWLHRQRTDSDVVTTAVKHVWGNVAVGSLAAYDIPLYRLPEGD